MTRKEEVVQLILSIDHSETERHCKSLPIKTLENWIVNYRRYNVLDSEKLKSISEYFDKY